MMSITEKISAVARERLADKVRQTRQSGPASAEERAAKKVESFRALRPAALWLALAVLIGLAELWVFRAAITTASAATLVILLVAFAVLPALCLLPALYQVSKVDHEGLRELVAILKEWRSVVKGGT
jgi:uncharacterized membrane protein YdfJ with MMPL/SSD domain